MFDIYNACYEALTLEKRCSYTTKGAAEEYGIPEKLYRNFKKTGRIEPQCEADNLLFLPRPIRPKRFLKEARLEASGEQSVNEAALNLGISVEEYIQLYNTIANAGELPKPPKRQVKQAQEEKQGAKILNTVGSGTKKAEFWWENWKKNL